MAFVGKGITFDSGGLNLKPGEFMRSMKADKSGACNVFAILRAAAKLKLPVEVHGIAALAENMPGSRSFRPDDILRMKNGKTVEIDNTDAEGRLVLADALCYASGLSPDVIIDMATLTGACAVALGNNIAGLFTPDDSLAVQLSESGKAAGERLWRMPDDDERIFESMKSPVADLVNSGSRYGGAIFAARFLREFVGEGLSWGNILISPGSTSTKRSGRSTARVQALRGKNLHPVSSSLAEEKIGKQNLLFRANRPKGFSSRTNMEGSGFKAVILKTGSKPGPSAVWCATSFGACRSGTAYYSHAKLAEDKVKSSSPPAPASPAGAPLRPWPGKAFSGYVVPQALNHGPQSLLFKESDRRPYFVNLPGRRIQPVVQHPAACNGGDQASFSASSPVSSMAEIEKNGAFGSRSPITSSVLLP